MKQKLVVLTGAGISAESGIKTFREGNGLWEEYDISEVATPEGWNKNKELVLDFYNQRRKQLFTVEPNQSHHSLVDLEEQYDVHIITQNVDNLHERAGSSNVLHLHGELMKSRSSTHPHIVYDIKGSTLNLGDLCEKGSQLRPHIVWFGEMVPEMDTACKVVQQADIVIVVGTSMQVYPAAGLIDYAAPNTPKYIIDPNEVPVTATIGLTIIQEKASVGLPILASQLMTK